MKLYIFAGTYNQARHYARGAGLSVEEWQYISNSDSLRGIRNIQYVKTGTWYDRSDWHLIETRLMEIGAEFIK
jgi:beta-lactam-binding protein with PASTA domain